MASVYATLPEPPKVSLLALSADGVLEDLIAKASLRMDEARTLHCSMKFESFDAYWEMLRHLAGYKSMIDVAGEEKILAAALAGAKPSINDAGELRFNNAYRLVIARR
jgi:hypothetical protein